MDTRGVEKAVDIQLISGGRAASIVLCYFEVERIFTSTVRVSMRFGHNFTAVTCIVEFRLRPCGEPSVVRTAYRYLTPTWRHNAAENVDGNSQHAYPSSWNPLKYSSRPSSVSIPSKLRIIRLALGEVRGGLIIVSGVEPLPHPARIPSNTSTNKS